MAAQALDTASTSWLQPLAWKDSGTAACPGSCLPGPEGPSREAHRSGCMMCGAELIYLAIPVDCVCHFCGKTAPANARCVSGHFICDCCHTADPTAVIEQVCVHSREHDAVSLMQSIRVHPHFGVHGPEHHPLVPAVILAALRNQGQAIPDEGIRMAIQRGKAVPGGACAFMGACGAAIGVGIAVSILLEATPYEGRKRQLAQQATWRALERIASFEAPRCCQRDSWLALQEASRYLDEALGMTLVTGRPIACDQMSQNKECIRDRCPLWHTAVKGAMR